METEITRITPANTDLLAQVDPEVFDHPLSADRLAAFVAEARHLLVIARKGALVVGQIRAMVHLQPDGPAQLYIDNLGVAPQVQRQGIALSLLHAAFLWGQDRDCAEAWVATEPDNLPARAIYARMQAEPEAAMAFFLLDIRALNPSDG